MKKRMKVLFVAHSGEISGGANRSLISLLDRIKAKGEFLPCVLIPESGSALQKICEDMGILVYTTQYGSCCTVFRREGKDILRAFKLLAAPVIQYFQARRLDRVLPKDFVLVYTNDRMIAVGAWFARFRGIGHIWHVRSFGKENKSYYPLYWYKLMDKCSAKIVLISEALRKEFAQHIFADKLITIHNGIEMETEPFECNNEGHEGFRMLLCGRIVRSKGQADAIRALEILHKQGLKMSLYFAGDVPSYEGNAYYNELCEQIETAGLKQYVHFLGEVEDMIKLRSTMDLELVCAWCEAFGRVTVEAMRAGLPVVGTNAGGTPEIILEGQTGLLYTPCDAEELATRIREIYENPQEARMFGEKGRKRALDQFSMERCAENVYRVITEVVCNGHEG